MKYLKVSIGIFLTLAASRFIPHPPNFTSLLALSFYIPTFLGIRYVPALLLSFIITDLHIGLHGLGLFTWGSVIIIGLLSKYFTKSIVTRIFGALTGALVFYLVTNFGVWLTGYYEHSFNGLLTSYTLAIPFFTYSLISTFIFASLIETIYKFKSEIFFIKKFKNL
jgi:hypothetical protein